ncbi:MAG: tetratricopeptide repeat protein [Treponema sp.]|jgi:Tfp pilus assembly protein PilF|nr:tetratricopeptide repeat protein [Treponema sp.]
MKLAEQKDTVPGINVEEALGFLGQGKLREAVETFTAILNKDPQSVPAYNGLGIIYGILQKYNQGCVLFHRGLVLDPDNAMLHYNYGTVLLAQGRLNRAAAEYQEALRCKPEWYKPANKLGILLGKQGRYANALEVLSATLKFNSRNPEIRETIKQILVEQEAARQALKKNEAHKRSEQVEEAAEVPVITSWDLEVKVSALVDLLKYLARLAEYLPPAERERFIQSDTPSRIYHILQLTSPS